MGCVQRARVYATIEPARAAVAGQIFIVASKGTLWHKLIAFEVLVYSAAAAIRRA